MNNGKGAGETNMRSKINIKDVARIAGVSPMTVSRVINGDDCVSQAKRLQVTKAIRESGYQPNQLAKGLRENNSRMIGILVPNIMDEYYERLVFVVQSKLLLHRYLCLICYTNGDRELELNHLKMLNSIQISGLIRISGSDNLDLPVKKLPRVYIDRDDSEVPEGQLCVHIHNDNFNIGKIAAEALIAAGCRHIAINYLAENCYAHKVRCLGFEHAYQQAGIKHSDVEYIIAPGTSPRSDSLVVQKYLMEHTEVDGLFCATDKLALGAQLAIRNLNIQVPEALKLVGAGDFLRDVVSGPSLSSVRLVVSDTADIIVEELLSMMETGKPLNTETLCMPVQLMKRDSLGYTAPENDREEKQSE